MGKIRILLADDHGLFREGLAGIINSQPDMEVLGEASDGLEAVVKAAELKPDLILMDIQMPGQDGLEATRQILREAAHVAIVILTVRDEPEKLFQAIKNGARGYLLKSMSSKEMIAMLRGVIRGEAPIAPAIAVHMLEEFRRLSRLAPGGEESEATTLTGREQTVLSLAAAGKSDKEIADELTLSLHTVKTHMRNILAKLHVSNRRQAAQAARQKGLV
jgi:two-component system NarL family response regulator